MTGVTPYPLALSGMLVAGAAQTVAYGPMLGGQITNPQAAEDQNLEAAENLYVNLTGPAGLIETATTIPIPPGGTFVFPTDLASNVSVNAASFGHRYSGYILQPATQYPPTPQSGDFPPDGPVTLIQIIPSVLYQEYNDDDDLQAFVGTYNALAQTYADWNVNTPLAVYTDDAIVGPLLDWVAEGVYGMVRPALESGLNRNIGPLNTYTPNQLPPNVIKHLGPINVTVTSDDTFKRIMTWNFYKGDGPIFNVRWIKRRVMRFLLGVDGSAPNIDTTYNVSVTYGNGEVAIRINRATRKILSGAFPNRFGPNQRVPLNSLVTQFNPSTSHYAEEPVLQQAQLSGALQFPFQYEWSILI